MTHRFAIYAKYYHLLKSVSDVTIKVLDIAFIVIILAWAKMGYETSLQWKETSNDILGLL